MVSKEQMDAVKGIQGKEKTTFSLHLESGLKMHNFHTQISWGFK